MTDMVRKQIYLEKRQQKALKQRARATGMSESEIVRQAVDRELYGNDVPTRPDPDVFEEIRHFILDLEQRKPIEGEPYRFNRDELYEDRLNRYESDSN
jgi:Ribbon-helix-helix protein, copG family